MPPENRKDFSVAMQTGLRTRAERAVLRNDGHDVGEKRASDDLIHELRVHQVELEIQNEELQAARNELEKSQKYLSQVFYHAPVGYAVLDMAGTIREINQAGVDILGRVAGMPGMRLQAFVGPEHEYRFSGMLKEMLGHGEPQREEMQLATMQGSASWVRVDLALLESIGTASILCTLVPMDKEIEARETLSRSNEELERLVQDRTRELQKEKVRAETANSAKTTFLANMSHEIRTPLNGVLSMLELLRDGRLDSGQQELIDLAALSGNNLLEIIGDILDLAKIESETQKSEDVAFDLEEFLHKDVLDIFAHQAQGKSVDFRVDLHDSMCTMVHGDRQSLRQVLINILGNALKFTSSGEVAFEAWRSTGNHGGQWFHVCITDTGIGMSDDELGKIFLPFSQADESHTRQYQGTGLGLTIVRKLLQRTGGSLCVESEPGRGTAFWMTLKLATVGGAAAAKETVPGGAPKKPESGQRRLRVLVVEDNRVNLLALEKFLERFGHEPVLVTDGVLALDALRRETFDCVLMDVQMPVMDGIEATKRIRSDVSGTLPRDIPIIAVTAHALAGDREVLLEAGMDDYLTKPLSLQKLQEVLERAVGPGGTGS